MQFPFQNSNPNSSNPFQIPNPLPSFLQSLKTQATSFLQSAINSTNFNPRKPHAQAQARPPWARIFSPPLPPNPATAGTHRFDLASAGKDVMEERLAGVPVYALSNAAEEFVLLAGVRTGKSLGLFCFNKDDAETMLDQMRSMDADMREDSRVVAVALNKVFQLHVDGVAFRLIPDPRQVAIAVKEKEIVGQQVEDFHGVPVFQSRSLALRSKDNKRYRPIFFKKEDLDNTLLRAAREQNQLNPAFRKGDTEVFSLEEIITAMKGDSASKWDDVVFIPPNFDVPTESSGERSVVSA